MYFPLRMCHKQKSFFSGRRAFLSAGLTDLGFTNLIEHKIELTDPNPVQRIPPGMYEELREHLRDMIKAGAIRESQSPFSSKKDNCLLFCIDFRKMNSWTVPYAYSLPRIDNTTDCLAAASWIYVQGTCKLQ